MTKVHGLKDAKEEQTKTAECENDMLGNFEYVLNTLNGA